MLSKNERIKYSGLFTQAFQKGTTIKSANLRLSYTKTLEKYSRQLPLFGIVVSKSFSKKAVLRNKIKRRIREVYRLFRKKPENAERLKSIGLLVISIKPEAGMLDYKSISEELHVLLKKL